jgi:peptidoglycan/xylan/chitin deacetylase (PgdA/CDA1 family)
MTNWQWPENAKAAVSLSYDDGNTNNLDQAMPDLEAAGLRGTFYLQISREDMQERITDWHAAHERGHEIGNHSVHHWCRADEFDSVPEWMTHSLEQVSPAEIRVEVAAAADWLDQQIGQDPDRTFAHPCGALGIGPQSDEASYDAAIRARHFAARTCLRYVNDPSSLNFLRLGAFSGHGDDAAPLIAYCETAVTTGGWIIFVFHGIGGPSHTFERAAHQALIAHLQSGPYWVAPVKTVGRYVQSQQPK